MNTARALGKDLLIRGATLAMATCVACTASLAAERRFHVTVRDAAGTPMPDIVVSVRARGLGASAISDAAGAATVSLEIANSPSLAVVWLDEYDLLSISESEKTRLRRRSMLVPAAEPDEQLVRIVSGDHDYSVELRYQAIRPVHGVITQQGQPATRLWEVGTPYSGITSPRTAVDGSFTLPIEPAGVDVMMEIYGDTSDDPIPSRSHIVRVPNASIGPDGSMGTINIVPTAGLTGNVVFHLTTTPEQYAAVHAVYRRSFWGLTLVSSDGKTVIDLIAESDTRVPEHEPAVMPVGTYFAVPLSFSWTWTQRRIIEACLDGVDLSTSGIPSITVTEGANMEVNIDPVAAELAIQNFFTPPE